jgi:hypothetical protein
MSEIIDVYRETYVRQSAAKFLNHVNGMKEVQRLDGSGYNFI